MKASSRLLVHEELQSKYTEYIEQFHDILEKQPEILDFNTEQIIDLYSHVASITIKKLLLKEDGNERIKESKEYQRKILEIVKCWKEPCYLNSISRNILTT